MSRGRSCCAKHAAVRQEGVVVDKKDAKGCWLLAAARLRGSRRMTDGGDGRLGGDRHLRYTLLLLMAIMPARLAFLPAAAAGHRAARDKATSST